MKIAFFITRNPTNELIGCLLSTISNDVHETTAIHFAEDSVYHLIKGTKYGEIIRRFVEAGIKVTVCECSVKNRNIEGLLIEGVKVGHIDDFLDACDGANIISL
ncbi:MAG: DsrE family protein [Armatimonadota bacterium]|nr:DsrE family protein [Armatimonadota bacterium]MDW8026552.1 DsrE family protein [Armatimonadota bacterium]